MASKGVKLTEEHKRKIAESHRGVKAYQWKGGLPNCPKCGIPKSRVGIVCRNCYKVSIPKGKQNPGWKGGYERKLFLNSNYRARAKQALGSFSFQEWQDLKEMYQQTCPRCKRVEPEITLTIDHITPLSRHGMNSIGNIQPLCASCNSAKGARFTIQYAL